ncbi:MAG: hypothetical protein H3Z53_08030 [archaeon]|nr:hypothetical protein [archaeon]MCP8317124.1 hypothetical protein [archaeon]
MPVKPPYIVTCPVCKEKNDATRFIAVNIPFKREVKSKMDFRVCPMCGTIFDVYAPIQTVAK